MSGNIHFFNEGINFRLKSILKTRAWLRKVVQIEGKGLGQLNYIFCSDAILADINIKFLKHNTLTDIITFNTAEEDKVIEGDIYISVDRVKENAKKYEVDLQHELHRVMVHGILHLVGYSDKTPAQKQQMRKKEDASLSLRDF
jgi:rRNA maturation RNase YbeY